MRFEKYQSMFFIDSNRRRAAIRRKHLREQQKYPLFAAEIEQSQPSVDQVMDGYQQAHIERELKDRSQQAKGWIKARASLRSLPKKLRCQLYAEW